jgi:hypothetical protein
MSGSWDDVEPLLVGAAGEPPPSSASFLHALLEETLSTPERSELLRASNVLEGALRKLLASAPEETRKGVLGDPGNPFHIAYLLGQVAMAQGLVAYAHMARVDASFATNLTTGPMGRVATLLAAADRDPEFLIEAVGLTKGEGAALMSRMIQDGSVDFRKTEGRIIYFLTPAAMAVMAAA